MSQAVSVSIKAPKLNANAISTHETTPLPLTRKSQKEKPVSPGAIIRKYHQSIHESNDSSDLFPITEDVSRLHINSNSNNNNNNNNTNNSNDESKRSEFDARKSYNNVISDLSAAAASAKREHQKKKSREIMEIKSNQSNPDDYSSDTTSTSQSSISSHSTTYSHNSNPHDHSFSNPHNIVHRTSEHPYIDDGGSDSDDAVDSSFSNDPHAHNPTNIAGRYSTFVRSRVTEPDNDVIINTTKRQSHTTTTKRQSHTTTTKRQSKAVSFVDTAHDTDTKPKRARVRFSIQTDDHKEEEKEKEMTESMSDNSSSLTSQSDDLLDDFFNDKPNYDGIEDEDILSSSHSLHEVESKHQRKSIFLRFGGNFLQSTLQLTGLTNIDVNTEKCYSPGAPLPNLMENAIEFSDTASTIDFNENLWFPVLDRSDSSDDSFTEAGIKRKKKRKKKKKKRSTMKTPMMDPGAPLPRENHTFDEKDIEAEIDLFKQSILDDNDDDDDDDGDDTYDLDESSSNNPFGAIPDISDDTEDDSDDDHSAYYDTSRVKGDRMWFRHHIGHLKVLKKFFREMDKDKGHTIDFDEFSKFINRYRVNKRFTSEEIERFFLKVTELKFDPDHPNAIEDKMSPVISPDLLAESNSSLQNSYKKSLGINKKTSIFFKKSKTAPTGEMNMPTFLFYFSSPIDSETMNQQLMEDGIYDGSRANSTIHTETSFKRSILPDKVIRSKYSAQYTKAAAIAADKAKKRSKAAANQKKDRSSMQMIDPTLLFITNKPKKNAKRHSLITKSSTKKLKKRINPHDITKRGSISTLRSYHSKRRASKNMLISADLTQSVGFPEDGHSMSHSNTVPRQEDMQKMHALHAMNELLNSRISGKYTQKNIRLSVNSPSDADADESMIDKKYNNSEELEGLMKLMKKNIQVQDRKDRNNNKYKNCFVGRDVVTWFLNKGFVSSRHHGLLLGRKLAQKKYINYAGNKERDFEDEIIFFYQFTHKEDEEEHKDNNRDSSLMEPTLTNKDSEYSELAPSVARDSTTTSSQTDLGVMVDGSPNHSTSNLAAIVSKMNDSIPRTSHRSNTLVDEEDIFSGKEIVDWLIKNNNAKDRTEAIHFGLHLRSKGFIRHIEFDPVFRDAEDEWYRICEIDTANCSTSPGQTQSPPSHNSVLFTGSPGNKSNGKKISYIMENEANNVSYRPTMPPALYNNNNNNNKNNTRRSNDSLASNTTTASDLKQRTSDRTSLVLGQMGKGRATRGRKREKLVQDLFTFIIRSQITTAELHVSPETLYQMDMIIDGAEHPHVAKLLSKIETKFKKCDEHSRGSLGMEEFNRFLMKCGVILHQQDLNVVFKIFDKNNTGLIDRYNFSDNALVHRVPGIKTENLTIAHLIKHTISVNFGISSDKKGGNDQYTAIAMAIAAAFEEINTSSTGEITLDEFRLAYRKHGIEIYGGVTQIFQRLSKNGATVPLSNFIEAFQGTIFANRAEPPKLKEVLSKLGIIQWTLGDDHHGLYDSQNEYAMNNEQNEYDDDNSVNTAITAVSAHGGYTSRNKHLNVTPARTQSGDNITPQTLSGDAHGDLNLIDTDANPLQNDEDGHGYIVGPPSVNDTESLGMISPTTCTTNSIPNNQQQRTHVQDDHGRTSTLDSEPLTLRGDSIIPMSITSQSTVPLETDKLERLPSITNELKSPHVQIRLNWREASERVFSTFFKSAIVIAFPGVILNSLLHFIQAIPVGSKDGKEFPLIDLTWYLFGFLVYLALQSTMVGFDVTKSLILLYAAVAGTVGAVLAIATIVDFALESGALHNWGLGWWIGLFLVYLICECAARLKFMQIFGPERTKREFCWYALRNAIGVTLFWFIQTFMSILVVNVSFDELAANRWPLIIYCAATLTVIRNFTLNTLGTAFIAKLSDHFYLEDVEVMEMRTDQMLLTQLSIISSYSPLWYLFTKTTEDDWNWVICGILVYQLILLFMDITLTTYIRPKMISLLKGELIAWFAVGARAIMNYIFPFGFTENSLIEQEYDNKWTKYINTSITQRWASNLTWCATYCLGPVLLLLLLWLRVYKIWSYENIENYWDFNDFTMSFSYPKKLLKMIMICCKKSNNSSSDDDPDDDDDDLHGTIKIEKKSSSNKQRNRLMIICALTIGFIVSVTETVSLWSDNPDTEKYDGFLDLSL